MTIPSVNRKVELSVDPPNNQYYLPEVSEDGIFLSSNLNESLLDPKILLVAQYSGKLFVSPEKQFFTNVHSTVYEDFIRRSSQWKQYLKHQGWKSLPPHDQLSGRAAAGSIQQEYLILSVLGREERCMFTLESIAGHLAEVMRLESLFFSLIQ